MKDEIEYPKNRELIVNEAELSIDDEQLSIVQQCLKLFEQEVTMKKVVKDAQAALDEVLFAQ